MKKLRIISLILSCAMLFALAVPAFATEKESSATISGKSELYPLCATPNEMRNLGSVATSLAGLPVEYQYTIERSGIEDGFVQVTLNLSIQDNDTVYQGVVVGTPEIHILTTNGIEYEYISGPLRGEMYINNNKYNVIVGFQKHSGSPEIQGDVTLQDADYNYEPVFFTFGNAVVGNDLREAIRNLNEQEQVLKEDLPDYVEPMAVSNSNPNSYTYGRSSTEPLTSHSDVDAVTVTVHYNEYQNRVMGSAIPHVAAVKNKFVHTPFESIGIDTLSIELEELTNRTDGDFEGVCYIPQGETTGKYSVSSTFTFFASVLDIVANVPWFNLATTAVSVICDVVEDNRPRCTVTDNINYVSVSYDFREFRSTELDKCGISIIAGMGPFREGMTNPIARFTARANASYVLRMRAPASGFDSFAYYDAKQASVSCQMSLT